MNNEAQRSTRNVSFLVASIILHLVLLIIFVLHGRFSSSTDSLAKKPTQPSVQFLDISQMDKMLEKKVLVEQSEDEKASKLKPKDAKFMSKVDKAVEKEMTAVNRGDFKNENSNSAPPPKSDSKSNKQARVDDTPESQKTPAMKMFENGDFAISDKKKPVKAKSISDLRSGAMDEMSEKAFASVSQNNDYLKDVVAGAQTQLNTREFLYYTYFNRIKKKLRQHWEPIIHEKVRGLVRQGREIASNATNTTSLVITLDAKGVLVRVQVLTGSGLEDLDQAALEALKVAAPFPNPPKDLVVEGFVHIPWDFVLES